MAVDELIPLSESAAGNSYIMVAGDYFTCWMEAFAIPNQGSNHSGREIGRSLHEILHPWAITLRPGSPVQLQTFNWNMLSVKNPEKQNYILPLTKWWLGGEV